MIILLPPSRDGSAPPPESHYPLSDPFYHCLEEDICQCPIASFTKRASVDCILPGDRFDGRLTGREALLNAHMVNDEDERWWRNLSRPCYVDRPVSCYAVITPDGLWHECHEPEPHDLVRENQPVDTSQELRLRPSPDRILSRQQIAWRYEVEALLTRHGECWALGCTAHLTSGGIHRLCEGY